MKTHYKILWVDDDMKSVEDDQAYVKEFFLKYGIKTEINAIESTEDGQIHKKVAEVVDDPELDLIVVDFMMGGMDGQQLISLIRQSDHVFLPVIFYSSAGVRTLANAAAESELDGVYLTNRDNITKKIELVSTSLLKKEQTSKRVRGLLMEGVSEIDVTFGSILNLIWERLDSTKRSTLIEYVRGLFEERAKSSNAKVTGFPSQEPEFCEKILGHFVTASFDTSQRWRVVLKALKLAEVDLQIRNVFMELFETEKSLIKLRNDYAHQSRDELDVQHSEDTCIHIRKELHRHTENLKQIE